MSTDSLCERSCNDQDQSTISDGAPSSLLSDTYASLDFLVFLVAEIWSDPQQVNRDECRVRQSRSTSCLAELDIGQLWGSHNARAELVEIEIDSY